MVVLHGHRACHRQGGFLANFGRLVAPCCRPNTSGWRQLIPAAEVIEATRSAIIAPVAVFMPA